MTKSGCCWEQKTPEEVGKSFQLRGGQQRLWDTQKTVIQGGILSSVEEEKEKRVEKVFIKGICIASTRVNTEIKLEQESLPMIALMS